MTYFWLPLPNFSKHLYPWLYIKSTFGVTGNQWRYAAKATVTTMVSSFGGGLVSLVMSFFTFDGKIDVLACVNGVLGALVGITG